MNDFGKYSFGKYTIGRVVLHRDTKDLGHILGFDRGHYDHGHETILKVLWDDGEVRSINPSNIQLISN